MRRRCFLLLAVTPAMGGVLLLLILEITHRTRLGEHLTSQVVLGRCHVMTPGHVGHRQCQTTTGLVCRNSPARFRSSASTITCDN